MSFQTSSCAALFRAGTRSGVSVIALATMGLSAPVWAQNSEATQVASDDSAADDNAIIVTGRRAALQSADDRKKNSSTIIDSVVADDAGKLPDNSITEVLQRVSGVTIVRFAALGDPDHFSVEGSGIQIRGLSGVASRLNGRDIFSANAGRSLLWGDVTPELMQAVDVYKSASADQIEGGLGGTVDLRTKLPFDFSEGLHIAGTGEVSTGDLAKKGDYSASGLVAGRWSTGIGDIGFVLDGAYSKLTSNSHFYRMEPYYKTNISGTDYYIPGGYDFGEEEFERKRNGIYGAVQWAPSSDLTFTGIFFQSQYKNTTNEWASFVTSQTLAVDPSESVFDKNNALISSPNLFQRDSGTFGPNGSPIYTGGTTGVSKSNTKTQDISFSAEWAPADSRLSVRSGYQHINSTSKTDRLAIFRDFQFPTSFGLDLSDGLPVVSTPGLTADYFNDASKYQWAAAMPHNEDKTGKMDAVNLDLEYDLGDGFFKNAKVGGRWSKRTERDFNNGYAWTALGRGWNGDAQMTFANAAPGDVEQHVFENFFHGSASIPGNMLFPSIELAERMDVDQLHQSPGALCGAPYATDLWWDCSAAGAASQTGYGGPGYRETGFLLPQDQTDFSTESLAGYVMTSFGTYAGDGEVTGNVGVRVVNVKNSSSGYFQQFSTGAVIKNGEEVVLLERAAIREGGAEFTRFLPAINVTYSPQDEFKIRAAYNITMDLPTFSALSAAGQLGIATVSNPDNPPAPAPSLPPIFTNFTTTAGNPELKPAMSNNVDLSFEWYPTPGTTAHVAAFYKHISDLPIYAITEQPVTVYYADGSTEDTVAAATAVRNASEAATVKGVEVGGRYFVDSEGSMLQGFGVEANYTFIDSKNPGDIYRDINGVEHNDAPLQGLSKHNFNVALLYENDPISFRLAYSWRSQYLQSTNASGTNGAYNYYGAAGMDPTNIQTALPIYGAAYGTLDAGITVKALDNLSVSLQATNLTNSTAKTLMGGYPGGTYTRSWFQSDRRMSLGVSFTY